MCLADSLARYRIQDWHGVLSQILMGEKYFLGNSIVKNFNDIDASFVNGLDFTLLILSDFIVR